MPTSANGSKQVEPQLVGHIESEFTRYSLALLLAHDVALAWLYRGPSAVPDERWFLFIAKQAQPSQAALFWFQDLVAQMNVLEYGAAYRLIDRARIV